MRGSLNDESKIEYEYCLRVASMLQVERHSYCGTNETVRFDLA